MRSPVSRHRHDRRVVSVAQEGPRHFDCRGATLWAGGLECRVGLRSAWSTLAVEGRAAAVALDVHLEDGGVVDEAIDSGQGHGWIGEDLVPFAGRLIAGDDEAPFSCVTPALLRVGSRP